ncbi:MAG: type I-F CRISPR-associated protein Csy2 [Pseudomonadota bacterium]
MSQYILINRIRVQNANTIAGFTWGFPAITHFLGFTHNLERKMHGKNKSENEIKDQKYADINLMGCAVISHKQQVHTYQPSYDIEFSQTRNSPYLKNHDKTATPPVIEEGKMNMEVSLLIAYEGYLGENRIQDFCQWLKNTCLCQRLAGGTILDIADIDIYSIDDETNTNLRKLTRKLLPGFILYDRSIYLENHFQELQQQNPDAELFDAWMDFIVLKQKARPQSNLISQHFYQLTKNNPDNIQFQQLLFLWEEHLKQPYQQETISTELITYFSLFAEDKKYHQLLKQWQNYCQPGDKTSAVWEYIKKPELGFLVPIMVGYKAISPVYKNHQVTNTRDNESDVCFVEAVHSIGEWQSIHRIKTAEELSHSLWHYDYQDHWYLCKQLSQLNYQSQEDILEVPSNDYI